MGNQIKPIMKFYNYLKLAFFAFVGLLLITCGQPAKEETPTPEAAPAPPEPQITERYQVDEALNPLNVYRDFTKVYGDTLNLQLYEIILKPGDSIGMHEHLDHAVYVAEGGTLMVWHDGTDPVEYKMETGTGFIGPPLKDVAKNTGSTTVRLVITEVFRPRME